ncbi:MAG TPA: hypothetical protein VN519_00440, partial [Bryobacteraceae bacterium]|nr:hypothetical protein [Bryobacteraceae bacterium]
RLTVDDVVRFLHGGGVPFRGTGFGESILTNRLHRRFQPSTNSGTRSTYVHEFAREIGQYLNGKYKLIVNKSTVPVGSGNWVESIICDACEQRTGNRWSGNFSVASNPEFLKEGTALHDTFYPDRIVVGSQDNRAIALLSELYRPLLNQHFVPPAFLPEPDRFGVAPLVTTDLTSAEMIKYAANAFLAVKISFSYSGSSFASSSIARSSRSRSNTDSLLSRNLHRYSRRNPSSPCSASSSARNSLRIRGHSVAEHIRSPNRGASAINIRDTLEKPRIVPSTPGNPTIPDPFANRSDNSL